MKRIPMALTTGLLMGTATAAVAVPPNELLVKGTITPVACTPTFSNNGLVDYGKISRQDLNVDRSGNRIGLYSLHFDPARTVADALPQVYRTDSTTGGRGWSPSTSRPLQIAANSWLGFTDVAGSTAGPVEIRNLRSRVTLVAVIAPTSTLDLSEDAILDGSATLEVVYF